MTLATRASVGGPEPSRTRHLHRQRGIGGVALFGNDIEGGSWRGTLYGYMTPSGTSDNLVLLTGDGDYEGLSAIMFGLDNGTGYDVRGMVYPGELPPFPEMQELLAE